MYSRPFCWSADPQRVASALASWATGAAQTVYVVPTLPVGFFFVLQDVLLRNPTGVQPLAVTVRVNTGSAFSGVSLSSLAAGTVLSLGRGATATSVPVASAGQSITITPAAAAAGATTVDLMGYFVDD